MNKKDYMLYFRVDPFSRVKNPWISGFSFAIGNVFAHNDSGTTSCCDRNRVRDHGPSGRQTLFDSGEDTIGRGLATFISTGIRWKYATYTFRALMGFQNYSNRTTATASGGTEEDPAAINFARAGSDQKARNFLIGHDVYVWSPKGLLTGSSGTPGSVLVGYHFERNDYSCGHVRTNTPCAAGGEFSRNRVILNEWDMWYFFMPGKSLGISWLWYDASNLRAIRGQAGQNLNIFKTSCGTAARGPCAGRGGDWLDVILGLRVNF